MASNTKKKASALTAALSGAPVAAPPPAPSSKSGGSRSLSVFPCLAYAPDDGSELPDLSELTDGLDALEVKGYTVVGSAPTRTSLPNGTPLVRRPGGGAERVSRRAHVGGDRAHALWPPPPPPVC
jgi:hypothetical protein